MSWCQSSNCYLSSLWSLENITTLDHSGTLLENAICIYLSYRCRNFVHDLLDFLNTWKKRQQYRWLVRKREEGRLPITSIFVWLLSLLKTCYAISFLWNCENETERCSNRRWLVCIVSFPLITSRRYVSNLVRAILKRMLNYLLLSTYRFLWLIVVFN